MNYCFYFY